MPVRDKQEYKPLSNSPEDARWIEAQPRGPEPGFLDLLVTGAMQDNLTINMVGRLFRKSEYEPVPGYEASKDPAIAGLYDMFPSDFVDSVSPTESAAIARRIDETMENEQMLSEAGGVGMLASFLGSLPSLETIIPVAPIASSIGRGAARLGLAMRHLDEAEDLVRWTGGILSKREAMALKKPIENADEVARRVTARNTARQQAVDRLNLARKEEAARRAEHAKFTKEAKAKNARVERSRTEKQARILNRPENVEPEDAFSPDPKAYYRSGQEARDFAGEKRGFVKGQPFDEEEGFVLEARAVKGSRRRDGGSLDSADIEVVEGQPVDVTTIYYRPEFWEKGNPTELAKLMRKYPNAKVRVVATLDDQLVVMSPTEEAASRIGELGALADRQRVTLTNPPAYASATLDRRRQLAREVRSDAEVDARVKLLELQTKALNKLDEAKLAALEAGEEAAREVADARLSLAVSTPVRAAAAGAATGFGSEVALQAVQDGRNDDYIASALIGSAVLGTFFGGLGGIGASMTARRVESMYGAIIDEMTNGPALSRIKEIDKLSPGPKMGGVGEAESAFLKSVERISKDAAKAIGVDSPILGRALKGMLHLSPSGRLAKSKSKTSNLAAQQLLPTPFLRKDTVGPSIQSRIDVHLAGVNLLVDEIARLRRSSSHGLDPETFNKEVIRILRSGGKVPDGSPPEISQAVKIMKGYYDDFDRHLRDAGLLKEVDLGADKGYVTRVYNHQAIEARRGEFTDLIAPYVGGRENAQEIVQDMLGVGPMSFDPDSYNFLTKKAGQLKARGLKDVPSSEIEDFLFADIDYLMGRYARQVGAQLEYARAFGGGTDGLNMVTVKQQIVDEYAELIEAAGSEKAKNRLAKQRERDLKDLEYVRQSQLGFLDRDPFNAGIRNISSASTALTSMAFLGNAGFNSMTDTAASFLVNGAASFWRTALNRVMNPLGVLSSRWGKDEFARSARLLEWNAHDHSRAGMFFDFLNDGAVAPKRGVFRRAHNGFMIANLLRPMTAFAREHSVLASQDSLLRASRDLAMGKKLSNSQRNNLLLAGLDEETAIRIGKQVSEGGAEEAGGGVLLGRLDDWSDEELARTFRAAVLQNSSRAVVTPSAGELPMMFRNELGRILFQFMSFPMGATNNFLVSSLQRRDAAVYGGIMMMTGLGMFVEAVNAKSRGEEMPDINELAARGFERMGMLGVVSNANVAMSRATSGTLDLARVVGAETAFERWGPIENIGDLVPGAAAFESSLRAFRTGVKLSNGEPVGEREMKAFVRRLPAMNGVQFIPVRTLFEASIRADQE